MGYLKEIIMFKFIFLFLLSFNACAFDEWSEADKTREAVYLAVDTVDWLQTRTIAKNPNKYYEKNPILGDHPSVGQVNNYSLCMMLAHVAAVTVIPSEYRAPFQYVSIAVVSNSVYKNYKLGITINF